MKKRGADEYSPSWCLRMIRDACFTLPLLKSTTLFIVITSLISYLQAYVQILVMTEGGPGTSTYTISYLIFDQAFQKYNFGVASAQAVILFLFTGVLTLIMFKISGDSEDLA